MEPSSPSAADRPASGLAGRHNGDNFIAGAPRARRRSRCSGAVPWRAAVAEVIKDRNWQAVIVEGAAGTRYEGGLQLQTLAEVVLVVTQADQVMESSSVLQALRENVAKRSVFLIVLVVDKATPDQILDAQPTWSESGADAILIHRGDTSELAMDVALCVRQLLREQAVRQAIAEEVRAGIQEEVNKQVQTPPKESLFWETAHLVGRGFPKLDASLPNAIHKGTIIGPCVVHSLLGAGASGQVYLGVGAEGSYFEAVKALPKCLVKDLQHFESLRKEASILMSLSHPNVVRCHGALHGPDHIFLRMEYAGKRNLLRVMREYGGRLPIELVCDFHQQLADAVVYCHGKGLAHRDIKPENIGVCDAEVTLRLLDFGTSCPVHKVCDDAVGTMPFIAPEVMCLKENRGYHPADVDVWAMGVVLLEMLCGAGALNDIMGWEYNFHASAKHASSLRDSVKANPNLWVDLLVDRVGAIPQALAMLINGLLAVYPARRWTATDAASCMWTRSVQKDLHPVPPSAPRVGCLARRLRTIVDEVNKNVAAPPGSDCA